MTGLLHRSVGAVALCLVVMPTWKEQGYDIVVANWRPIVGPRGLRTEQIAYWEGVLARFQTAEWKRELEATGVIGHFMGARELGKFLGAEHAEFKTILGELGLAR